MDQPKQPHPEADQRTDQTRRKMLRGAVAAPAIFTLPSGAALAGTSIACYAKPNSLPTPTGLARGTDRWVRVKLKVYQVNFQQRGMTKVVQGGSFWYLAFDTNGVPAGTKITDSLVPGSIPALTGEFVYGLVDYAKTDPREAYGYYPATGPAAVPVAGASCWNSIPSTRRRANRTDNVLI